MKNKKEKQCYVAPKIDVESIYLSSNFFGSSSDVESSFTIDEFEGEYW
ncbi:MAG: hypothetical protein ACOYEA_06935 [Fermentimonas sp.]|jgi:hypothetical protein